MTDHDAIAARVRQDRETGTLLTGAVYIKLADMADAYLDLYDEVQRLRAFMRMIVDDRDRTFVLLAERAEEAEAERDRLRAALTIYAQSGNWRLGGCCDPNSPNFTGVAIARQALKGDTK